MCARPTREGQPWHSHLRPFATGSLVYLHDAIAMGRMGMLGKVWAISGVRVQPAGSRCMPHSPPTHPRGTPAAPDQHPGFVPGHNWGSQGRGRTRGCPQPWASGRCGAGWRLTAQARRTGCPAKLAFCRLTLYRYVLRRKGSSPYRCARALVCLFLVGERYNTGIIQRRWKELHLMARVSLEQDVTVPRNASCHRRGMNQPHATRNGQRHRYQQCCKLPNHNPHQCFSAPAVSA